ncbi:FAD-dependent monooxygenase [Spirosoma oryzicola]|uniref:FAD-dependent monooxygenase n=1 Tax=Spirosoma oryzicola TaxID=2898794 RepID=UPI001E4B49A8|nr:FAD-dependent monooxygenase [Spirosoma oryzicola]UHG89781.1 FAD-dependent monooxygenase [Spirosoma oryzicola]
MPTSLHTDVLLVGAGPTGLSLACQFLRHGVDFILIDKGEGITPYSKAIGVQARTLEIYEQIGLAKSLIEKGNIAEKAQLLEDGKVRGEVALATVGQGQSPYPFLLLVEQSQHEQLLYTFLKQQGKSVQWKTSLDQFSQTSEGVTAHVTTPTGDQQTITAKYLVGCDGAKSVVRHTLGLSFAGSTLERLFYVADVHINWPLDHNSVRICLAKATLTAFFPLPGENRYRIVGTFPENDQQAEGTVLYEAIERQIKADTKLALDITQVNWFSTYKVHSRRVSAFSDGRCFVAGDAAHIHTPAGGQGMNTGIQDGYNLAWKLAFVLNHQADDRLLSTYNEERSANAKHLLETTDRMFDFGASPDWFLANLRTYVIPYVAHVLLGLDVVKKAVFPLISQIGINYRSSSLSESGIHPFSKVQAGDRMPYALIDGESIYNGLRYPKFHLLVFGDAAENDPDKLHAFVDRNQSILDIHHYPLSPTIQSLFAIEGNFSVLLRPDNYIALLDRSLSATQLKRYLRKTIGCAIN